MVGFQNAYIYFSKCSLVGIYEKDFHQNIAYKDSDL